MLSEKIVVIDDDARIIKSLELALSEYEIIGFTDCQKGLNFLQKPNLIQLVLLDVMMPEMDGLSLLQEIRKFNKDVAVIIMTAYGSKDVAIQALRHNANDFVEKPFDFTELKDKIRALLKEKLQFHDYKDEHSRYVERIKSFIERNYKNATLESIADEICLSPKYISRFFNKKNNENFREYKLKIRIDKAKSLLEKSHLNVSEIAIELGYQNPESFMRIFKRTTQLTPMQYRKKNGKMKI